MRAVKLLFLLAFALIVFGVPMAAWLGGPSAFQDAKREDVGWRAFLAPDFAERSAVVKSNVQITAAGDRLVGMRNRLDGRGFGAARNDVALSGRDGWLYYGLQFDICPSLKEITDSVDTARAIADLYVGGGVGFSLSVVPDKSTLYPEFVPSYLTGPENCRHAADVNQRAALAGHAPTLVDLYKPLAAMKPHAPIFHKTDTHWNDFGAVVGLEWWLSAVFARPLPDESYFRRLHDGGEARTRETDISRMLRQGGLYPEVKIKPPAQRARRGRYALARPVYLLHDSFVEVSDPFVTAQLPDARRVHLDRIRDDGSLIQPDLHIEPGALILVNTVQRSFVGRFSPVYARDRTPSGRLMASAVTTNRRAARDCLAADSPDLSFQFKTADGTRPYDPAVPTPTDPRTRLIARLPDFGLDPDGEEPLCLDIRYQGLAAGGQLYLGDAFDRFAAGYTAYAETEPQGETAVLRLRLPAHLQGRFVRFDLGLENGEPIRGLRVRASRPVETP